jgi:hypothetical protein
VLALDQSNLPLRIGSIAAISIYTAVFLLLLGILLLRFLRLNKDRRRHAVTETWRPLLAQCVIEVPGHAPAAHHP